MSQNSLLWSKADTPAELHSILETLACEYPISSTNGEFELKFRARKDTEAFDRILLQIDKANGLNPLNDLMNAFKDLQPEFYTRLSEQHPELSPRELEICALISLNMTSKQISVLLNITIKSVEVARHRIRKKINLHPDQNLTTEIMQLLSKN